jgi:hypothetical protein
MLQVAIVLIDRRKLAAKRANERTKLVYSTANTLAIGGGIHRTRRRGLLLDNSSRIELFGFSWHRSAFFSTAHRGVAKERRLTMSEAPPWWLTLEIVVLAAIVGGGSCLCVRHMARDFDRKYGERHAPGE